MLFGEFGSDTLNFIFDIYKTSGESNYGGTSLILYAISHNSWPQTFNDFNAGCKFMVDIAVMACLLPSSQFD